MLYLSCISLQRRVVAVSVDRNLVCAAYATQTSCNSDRANRCMWWNRSCVGKDAFEVGKQQAACVVYDGMRRTMWPTFGPPIRSPFPTNTPPPGPLACCSILFVLSTICMCMCTHTSSCSIGKKASHGMVTARQLHLLAQARLLQPTRRALARLRLARKGCAPPFRQAAAFLPDSRPASLPLSRACSRSAQTRQSGNCTAWRLLHGVAVRAPATYARCVVYALHCMNAVSPCLAT